MELSNEQKRIWLDYQASPNAQTNYAQFCYRLVGDLDVERFKRAIIWIAEQNRSLRTVFSLVDGKPYKHFSDIPPRLELLQFEQIQQALGYSVSVDQYIEQFLSESIDMLSFPSYKLTLLQVASDVFYFAGSMPHALLDGFSASLLLKQITAFYNAHHLESSPNLNRVVSVKPRQLEEEKRHWQERLSDSPVGISFYQKPLLNYRAESSTCRHYVTLSNHLSRGLNNTAKKSRSTIFLTLQTIFAVALYKYSQQKGFSLLYPVNTREPAQNGEIGFYVNLLPMSFNMDSEECLTDILSKVTLQRKRDKKYQKYPYNKLLHIARKAVANSEAKYNVIFSRTQFSTDQFSLKNIKVSSCCFGLRKTAAFDLALLFDIDDNELIFALDYNTSAYEDWFVKQFLEYFTYLIKHIEALGGLPLGKLPYFPDPAKQQYLKPPCQVANIAPTLQDLFYESVKKYSARIALSNGEQQWTYQAVSDLSDAWASQLLAMGVQAGERVGVLIDRDAEFVILILSLLKLRCAYVPLDLKFPTAMIIDILKDASVAHLVCHKDLGLISGELPNLNLIPYKDLAASHSIKPPGRLPADGNAEDLAYIIYSSGTTAKPKGIPIRQRNLTRLFAVADTLFSFNSEDIWSVSHSLAFDFSVWEIWGALLHGATALFIPTDILPSASQFRAFIKRHSVTILNQTPSYFKNLIMADSTQQDKLVGLRYVIFGAEKLIVQDLERWLDKYGIEEPNLINMYGLTELTVHATYHRIEAADFDKGYQSPIGHPLPDLQGYLVNDVGQLVPAGVLGEICLSGAGLTDGYLNRPELNNKKFFPNPFDTSYQTSLYYTGDLAFASSNGEWFYHGRADDQVKFKGYRIELQHIESIIKRMAGIEDAVVIFLNAETEDQKLIGFYQSKDASLESNKILEYLSLNLPKYMVPTYVLPVDSLPLTTQGKIDRKALIKVYQKGQASFLEGSLREAIPVGSIASKIHQVWQKVLKSSSDIPLDMPFFEAGGDSIDLLALHEGLRKIAAHHLTVDALFQYTTIQEQARYIAGVKHGNQTQKNDSKKKIIHCASSEDNEDHIAVIGLSAKFPGANSVADFWENLCLGKESLSHFGRQTLLDQGILEAALSSNYVAAKGVIDDADKFDADFFNIPEIEAMILDPQHRLFMELCWSALENAGYTQEAQAGRIGVFAGASSIYNYAQTYLVNNKALRKQLGDYSIHLNNALDFLSTRVSFKLNFTGPSVTIQSGCSTSLVAVCRAVRSLLAGECDVAVAGGVSLSMPLHSGYVYQPGMILSPDGHCRAFDAKANGTVPGNGGGVVVLKRLREAEKAGDAIDALIRGYAMNNDGGNKLGMTTPSQQAQEKLLLSALKAAACHPNDIDYIETHGTGTIQGDKIELSAINAVFENAKRARPCYLGTLKPNIGHLDAAAGIAGIIKTILCLKQRTFVPCVNFENPNAQVDFSQVPLQVNTKKQPWQTKSKPIAGVSAMAVGGTNAHVILEAYESAIKLNCTNQKPLVFVFSGKTPTALEAQLVQFIDYLEGTSDELAKIAYTLQLGRKAFSYKIAVVSSDKQALISRLRGVKSGQDFVQHDSSNPFSRLEWIFTSLSPKDADALRKHYQVYPEFRAAFDTCNQYIKEITGCDLLNQINTQALPGKSQLSKLNFVMLSFALQYALAKQYLKWGVNPSAVQGIGVAHYIAVLVSGIWSLSQTVSVLNFRQQLLDSSGDIKQRLLKDFKNHLDGQAFHLPQIPMMGNIKSKKALTAFCLDEMQGMLSSETRKPQPPVDKDNIWVLLFSSKNRANKQILSAYPAGRVIPCAVETGVQALETVLATLWEKSLWEDWEAFYDGESLGRVHLPTYPFERKRYWVDKQSLPLENKVECSLSECLYKRSWQYNLQASLVPSSEKRTLVLFSDESAAGKQLINQLVKQGISCHQVLLPFEDPSHYLQQFDAIGSDGLISLVYLALSASINNAEDRFLKVTQHFTKLTALIQSAGKYFSANSQVQITLLTHGLWNLAYADEVFPEQHLLLGPMLTAQQEYANLNFSVLDLEFVDQSKLQLSIEELKLLQTDLFNANGRLTAYRHQQRLVSQLDRITVESSSQAMGSALRRDGVYLITGGLGEVGLTFAEYFSKNSASHIVLLQRSALPDRANGSDQIDAGTERKLTRLEEIQRSGCKVHLFQCDICDQSKLFEIIAQIEHRIGKINGVVHAAGLASAQLIAQMSPGTVSNKLREDVKIKGTMMLHQALLGNKLDFMVLCSALSGVLGYPTQTTYNSANAFLDAFAHWRSMHYGRTISINWDAWKEGGMAKQFFSRVPARFKDTLMQHALSKKEAMEIIEKALSHSNVQYIVSTQNNNAILMKQLFSFLKGEAEEKHPYDFSLNQTEINKGIHGMIEAMWHRHFGQHVSAESDFFDLGGDSLAAIQMTAVLNEMLPFTVSDQDLIAYPVFNQFVEQIQRKARQANLRGNQQSSSSLIAMKKSKKPLNLFLIHPIGGSTHVYRDLCSSMSADINIYSLQSRALEGSEVPSTSVVSMAADYLNIIRKQQPTGPYHLAGLSFGGLLAYEMGFQLTKMNETVAFVGMFDTPGFAKMPKNLVENADILAYLLRTSNDSNLDESFFNSLTLEEQIDYFLKHARNLVYAEEKIMHTQMRRYLDIYRANMTALFDYRPQYCEQIKNIYFFSALDEDSINAKNPETGWQALLGERCIVFKIPGNHITMLFSPNVQHVAEKIDSFFLNSHMKQGVEVGC